MAHPCQALSSGTVQWQQDHLRALFPGTATRLTACGQGGQQAQVQHPLSWPWGLHLPCLVLKDTTTGDAAPIPLLRLILGRALPPFFHLFLPPAGPRHIDFAFWCQSLELSRPGLPSPDFQPLFPSGTGPLPGNRLPGILSRESSPPVFYSPAVSLSRRDPSPPVTGSSHPSLTPGQHFCGDAMCFYDGVAFLVCPHTLPHHPQVPCSCGLCPEHFFGPLHGRSR